MWQFDLIAQFHFTAVGHVILAYCYLRCTKLPLLSAQNSLKCSCCNLTSSCPALHAVKRALTSVDLSPGLLMMKEILALETQLKYRWDRMAISTKPLTFTLTGFVCFITTQCYIKLIQEIFAFINDFSSLIKFYIVCLLALGDTTWNYSSM